MPASKRAKLVLFLISTTVSLLLVEAALRIAGVSHPNFYQPDPVRGWELRPGAKGWWRSEGNAWVSINSDGMRDEEHPAAKPPGQVRIAVLGDSCAEALQVPADKTFWSLLEKELARCPAVAGRKVQSLDFGVSGYGTAQELLTLRHRVWKYDPDLVLLAFYTGNDVRNNFRPLDLDPTRPYLTPGPDGRLALDDSFRSTRGYKLRRSAAGRLVYWAFDHSRLLQVGKQAKTAVDGWVGAWRASRVQAAEAVHELGLDNAVYAPPADAPGGHWQGAWAATEAILRDARDEAAAHRTPFAVVSLTTGTQVHPDPRVRRDFMKKLGVGTLFYPDERLVAFGRREGIPVLALAPALQRVAEREKVYLHGFPNTAPGEGHWNERGHAAAAAEMAEWACGLLRSPQ